MSAQIIMFVPRPNPKRDSERAMQAMAQMAQLFWLPWFAAASGWTDTAPCEYVAPDEDPA